MSLRRRILRVFLISNLLAIAGFRLLAADGIQTVGDVFQFVLPVTAGGLALAHRDGEGALQLGASIGVAMAFTFGLKASVEERRPNGGTQSFPSGHTSLSFSAAEFIRKRYGWGYGIPAYAGASFVAYSRVESRQHHPQDVVAGAGIGILSSYLLTKTYNGWKLDVNGDMRGVRLVISRPF